jgi:hypothetical protein
MRAFQVIFILKTVIMFKEFNDLEKEWNEINIKKFIVSMIKILKHYDTELGRLTWINKRENLSLFLDGKGFASCMPFKGEIHIGSKFYNSSFKKGTMGYPREKKYIERRCSGRIEVLVWMIMHEYCHLFKGYNKHTNEFYEFIDKKYIQFLWYIFKDTKNKLFLLTSK